MTVGLSDAMTILSPIQIEHLLLANQIGYGLSITGSLCIIISYMTFVSLRKFLFKLAFCLSLCELFWGISMILGLPEKNSPACRLQAYAISYFGLSSILWTSAIAYMLYVYSFYPVCVNKTFEVRRERFIHLGCWGLPLLLTLLPELVQFSLNSTSVYGQEFIYCWFRLDPDDERVTNIWRLLQFYIPLLCTLIYNTVVYYRVNKALQSLNKDVNSKDDKRRRVPLMTYPLILVCCWSFGFANRIYPLFSKGSEKVSPFPMWMLNVIFGSLQGFFHGIAYIFTTDTYRYVKSSLFGRHFTATRYSFENHRITRESKRMLNNTAYNTKSEARAILREENTQGGTWSERRESDQSNSKYFLGSNDEEYIIRELSIAEPNNQDRFHSYQHTPPNSVQ